MIGIIRPLAICRRGIFVSNPLFHWDFQWFSPVDRCSRFSWSRSLECRWSLFGEVYCVWHIAKLWWNLVKGLSTCVEGADPLSILFRHRNDFHILRRTHWEFFKFERFRKICLSQRGSPPFIKKHQKRKGVGACPSIPRIKAYKKESDWPTCFPRSRSQRSTKRNKVLTPLFHSFLFIVLQKNPFTIQLQTKILKLN